MHVLTAQSRPLSAVSPSTKRSGRALGGLAMLALLAACGGESAPSNNNNGTGASPDEGKANAFAASSPDLSSGSFTNQFLLNGFGCTGGNVSPRVEWRNVPSGTQSFAVTVLDLDAPTGSGIWHWAVYDIPASATALPEGAGNAAASLPSPAYGGTTDLSGTGLAGRDGSYTGPCPPVGDKPHRYEFTVYAYGVNNLASTGGIPKTSTAGLYSFVLNKGIGNGLLGKASFTATYSR